MRTEADWAYAEFRRLLNDKDRTAEALAEAVARARSAGEAEGRTLTDLAVRHRGEA